MGHPIWPERKNPLLIQTNSGPRQALAAAAPSGHVLGTSRTHAYGFTHMGRLHRATHAHLTRQTSQMPPTNQRMFSVSCCSHIVCRLCVASRPSLTIPRQVVFVLHTTRAKGDLDFVFEFRRTSPHLCRREAVLCAGSRGAAPEENFACPGM